MSSRTIPDPERTRLTERLIKTLDAPPRGNVVHYDRSKDTPRGFGLRITAGDVRAFVLNYRVDGRERRLTIGKWPVWSASAARERAKELRRQIDQGIDPLGLKESRRGAPTLKEIAEDYISRHASKRKSGKETARYLRRELLPELGASKATDITKADLIRIVEAKAASAPIGANMLLSITKGMFAWANRVDLLTVNPAALIDPPARKVARDRYLSEAEIRTFWLKLDSAAMAAECKAALKLILTTGSRPGEVCSLAWSEIAGDVWTIPSAKHKAGRGHVVPLSSLAMEILEGCKRFGGEAFVFPSPARKGRHLTRIGLSQAALLNREHFGIPRWTPHDLRRTVGTLAPTTRFVKGLILGHADGSVTGTVYDHYAYLSEKRQALESWAAKLRDIIGLPAPQNQTVP